MKCRQVIQALGFAFLLPHFSFGQNQPLTLDQTLERARRRAPLILAAQDRIEEARGRLLGARVLLRDNPVLELSGGPRYRSGSDLIDAEVGLSQSFELGGRRRSQIAAAEAERTRALGDLRIFLGMRSGEPLSVVGLLATPDQYDLDHLTAEALKRPDFEAIAAELRQAEAEVQLGSGFAWPDLALGFRYGRDEGSKIAKVFFQAEDGIRYLIVTGVQTCALPISCSSRRPVPARSRSPRRAIWCRPTAAKPRRC